MDKKNIHGEQGVSDNEPADGFISRCIMRDLNMLPMYDDEIYSKPIKLIRGRVRLTLRSKTKFSEFVKAAAHPARIAVLDTGIDIPWKNMLSKYDSGISDANGHGSCVASIIRNIAPQSQLLIYRIADDFGMGSIRGVADAVNSAIREECQVIHISAVIPNKLAEIAIEIISEAVEAGIMVVMPSYSGNSIAVPGTIPVSLIGPAGKGSPAEFAVLSRYGLAVLPPLDTAAAVVSALCLTTGLTEISEEIAVCGQLFRVGHRDLP